MGEFIDTVGRRVVVSKRVWERVCLVAKEQGRPPAEVAGDAVAAGLGIVPDRVQAPALVDRLDELGPPDPEADAALNAALDGF